MKTAIVYFSKTGHSKKIAKAMAQNINMEVMNIKENKKPENVDLLFVVGGIYGGQSMPEMINYIKSLSPTNAKKAVLMTSCTTKVTPQATVRTLLQENTIEVLEEEFICQGSFLFMGMGHPNKADFQSATDFARKVIENQNQ